MSPPSCPGCGKLFLVGMPGAGKTTIGRQLARRAGLPFVDVDQEIERRTGVKIPLIFEYEGESGFRDREAAVLLELASGESAVIATGGGAVLRADNRACMQRHGTVVYLNVAPDILFERTRHDRNRPLLQVADPLGKLQALFADRDPFYRDVADIIVTGGSGNAMTLVKRIERELEQRCAA